MGEGLFIAGTDTGVGKTYVTCQLIQQYRRAGVNAVGMKPVASGRQKINGEWLNDDIEQICAASGDMTDRELINQYVYDPFIAPHVAAAQVGELISLQTIQKAYQQLTSISEQVIVEGAGGLMTPLSETETYVDLIQLMGLDVVLVVAIRLGCINHALLSQQVMQATNINFVGWVANYASSKQETDQDIEESLKLRLNAPLLGVIPWNSSEIDKSLDLSQLV